MYHLWRGLDGAVVVSAASDMSLLLSSRGHLEDGLTEKLTPASTSQKNRAAVSTMMATITEVIQVSRRVVQVTLRASERTSRANWASEGRFFGAWEAKALGAAITAAVFAARLRIWE